MYCETVNRCTVGLACFGLLKHHGDEECCIMDVIYGQAVAGKDVLSGIRGDISCVLGG